MFNPLKSSYIMKTPTIYATEKKSFIFAADSEQRGLNATLKALLSRKGERDANNTLAADALTWDIFKNASNYIAFLEKHLPIVFNASGALCSVKVVEDTTDNRDIYAGYQMEDCTLNGVVMVRVWIPKVKYTCNEVYNLAKKARLGAKAAEKAAEKAAKAAAAEAKKAERTAAKIAKLQAQLAELQK